MDNGLFSSPIKPSSTSPEEQEIFVAVKIWDGGSCWSSIVDSYPVTAADDFVENSLLSIGEYMDSYLISLTYWALYFLHFYLSK
jgi:hypothetical protein